MPELEKALKKHPNRCFANYLREIMLVQCSQTISKRDLLSLLCHLNFAMCIIPQGCSFISWLLDLSKAVNSLADMVTLDDGCSVGGPVSMVWKWNGISFFCSDYLESSSEMRLFTGAAPSVGFGGVI